MIATTCMILVGILRRMFVNYSRASRLEKYLEKLTFDQAVTWTACLQLKTVLEVLEGWVVSPDNADQEGEGGGGGGIGGLTTTRPWKLLYKLEWQRVTYQHQNK